MNTMSPEKILIIKPSSLGDIVHSLPVLAVLSRCFPGSEIHWLVAKGFEQILEGHPLIKKLWIIHKDEWKKISRFRSTLSEFGELFRELRAERFALVIDLQGLFRSGVIARATGSLMRIGFKEAREGSTLFYTHMVSAGKEMHAVDRYLMIPAFLGCDVSRIEFPFPPIDEKLPSDLILKEPYVIMVPGARRATKRWPPERFGVLASQIPLRTVVIGSRGDREYADILVRESKRKAVSFSGKTSLRELCTLIRNARLMVCNDTGPMHIAAALGIPVIAVFGPTSPQRIGPYGGGHTVLWKAMPCSPCPKRGCKTIDCMDTISVQEVFEKVKEHF